MGCPGPSAKQARPASTTALRVKLIAAIAVGNALEFYDFAVYSQLGAYLTPSFFPKGNKDAQSLSFWTSYGVAFLVRPAGSLLFGHVGDKHSRRSSLVWSLALMALPTALIGCLPTFAMAGWVAPVLLVLLRIAQGLAVGGENGTALVYLYESAPPRRRALLVALGWSGIVFGVLVGIAAVALLEAVCSDEQMMLWGWRVAFLAGAATGAVGILLRRGMPDPAVFLSAKAGVIARLEAEAEAEAESEARRASSLGPAPPPAAAGRLGSFLRAASSFRRGGGAAGGVGSSGGGAAAGTGGGGGGGGPPAAEAPATALALSPAPSSAAPASVACHLRAKRAHYFPAVELLRGHWGSVLLQLAWECWFAAGFYACTSIWPSLIAANVPGSTRQSALLLTMPGLVAAMAASWVFGALTDLPTPRMPLSIAIALAAAAAAAAAAPLSALGPGAAAGAQAALLALVRASGFSLAHQLAVGPIGGVTPVIISATAARLPPLYAAIPWLTACCAASVAAAAFLWRRRPESNLDPPGTENAAGGRGGGSGGGGGGGAGAGEARV
ncbi:MFS transporter [Raphidocelis subcapitata]|uniref:MFS transporter n=1 Tax=Raphidocelis subcapitata TaxID=307507 RepID=A0A2V0P5J6_9CHLO|nr:MFS transporter [Raphidocelis subcapitata]|eukprot:GBF92355.1 MFS transporter [Raphidocelis subcapitata]